MKQEKIRIVFVCLGNICRSPLAEGLFRSHVREAGLEARFEIESAGTAGFHIGKPPDPRTRSVSKARGIDLSHQRAQQLSRELVARHDLVLVMDRQNLADARRLASSDEDLAKIALFRDFDPEPEDGQVPDPYYGGEEGFLAVHEIVDRTSLALLGELRRRYRL
jgi:protein-tyrosine phosphatase